MHALLYLIVSLLAVALIFFFLGAPFVAALEVIIYAGAIMVLFIFVIMMLNLGAAAKQEAELLTPGIWIGPAILCLILAMELIYTFTLDRARLSTITEITPKQVGIAFLGPYVLGVELASMLLLAGLIGAYHLGRPHKH